MTDWKSIGREIGRITDPPAIVQDRERPFCLALDGVWAPNEDSAYLAGWMWDPASQLRELLLEPGEAAVRDRLLRTRRPDVTDFLRREYSESGSGRDGFVLFLENIRLGSKPLKLKARFADGSETVVARRLTRADPNRDVLYALLASLDAGFVPDLDEAGRRMEQALSERALIRPGVRDRVSIGDVPANPSASIVTPVSSLEAFKAQLAAITAAADAELVFVLDDATLAEEIGRFCAQSQSAATLLVLEGRAAQGCAYNIAAERASARSLLFLSADVLPARSGWLAPMLEFAAEHAGPLAPKLIDENDALVNAGLYFSREPGQGRYWQAIGRFEGYPAGYPPANESQRVQALDGSAILISRQVFERLEGFDETPMLDLEGPDLCLRAHRAGLESWRLPSVEFYRLRVPSTDLLAEARGDLLASWLLTNRWSGVIEDLVSQRPEPRPEGSGC